MVCLLGVVAMALFLRLRRLDGLSLWFDETFSLRMSQFPVGELVQRCTEDTSPPFFFLVLKLWVSQAGTGVWATRLLSTLWSTAAVACGFGFTWEALSTQKGDADRGSRALFAATLTAVCLALSPLQITWAQQVRMYAVVACLSILSTWLLWRAIVQPASIWRWLAYAAVELAGLYTHVTMLFLFAAHLAAMALVLWRSRGDRPLLRRLAGRGAGLMFVMGLLALPWVLIVRVQHDRVRDDFWSKPLDLPLLGEALAKSFTVSELPVESPTVGLMLGQGVVLLSLAVAAGRRPVHLLVATGSLFPFALLIAVSFLDRNIIHPRYFIAGQSLLYVAVGIVTAWLPRWSLRVATAALVLIGIGSQTSAYNEWHFAQCDQPGLPHLLRTWEAHVRADELLVFNNPMYHITSRIYRPDRQRLRIAGRAEDFPFFMGTAVTSPEDYFALAQLRQGTWQTLWVCDSGHRGRYLEAVDPGSNWRLVTETSFRDYSGYFILRRYDRRPSPIVVTERSP